MCCTGGGCPSWVCAKASCNWVGNGQCEECFPASNHTHYYDHTHYWNHSHYSCHEHGSKGNEYTHCHSTNHQHSYNHLHSWEHQHSFIHIHAAYCTSCAAYQTGGTCGWCTGNDPGNGGGGGGGGGCSWGSTIAQPACTQANGLQGKYYRDNPVGEPRFDGGLKLVQNDSQVNFDWTAGSPSCSVVDNDNFSVNWTGYINLSASGSWRFGGTSDDGFSVDLETTPGSWTAVMSDWPSHAGRTTWGAYYTLNAGWYAIRVWYYETSGNATAQLRYEGPGVAAVVVPSANLRTCSSPCSATAPSGLNATAITATSAQVNWTPGTGGDKQLVRMDADQTDVQNGCPGGVGVDADETTGTKCVLKDDNVPSGQNNYGTGSILSPGTRYYFRIVEYKDATCSQSTESEFVTSADPWVKVLNGLIHTNHLASLRVAPAGQYNARWLISARGSNTGTSQEGWLSPYYPSTLLTNLTLDNAIKAPSYATLWKRFGKGVASPYSGPTLPNSDGPYLISGNKTVSGVFNQAAGTSILVFVNGNLTIDAEIRVPSDSVITFIVSGTVNFSKSLAGGGGGVDNLGGLYLASGRINTAYDKSSPTEVTRQLVLEGSLISLTDTISLDRNLDFADNQTTPAEQINLSAKYYVLLKSVLGRPKFFYQEVPAGF